MDRRRFLHWAAAGCACAACAPAFGQWPQGNPATGELAPQSPPRLQGCMIGNLADMRFTVFGLKDDEVFVDDTFQLAQTILNVDGLVAVFEGPDSYNALASPEPLILQSRRTDEGSVFIGLELIRTEKSRRRSNWRSSLTMIIAHEASHLLQDESRLELTVTQMELHADYLAGWVMGRLQREGRDKLSRMQAAEDALRDMATSNFGDANYHGSADQRIAALRAGFGQRSYPDAPIFEGLDYLGIG
jgi:hypothetical protein